MPPVTNKKIIYGKHEDSTIKQFNEVSEHALHSALLADGHLGYVMPIGTVCAYRDQVSVAGVGYDIGCGNTAFETNINIKKFSREDLFEIADEIQNSISFGVGRTNKSNNAPIDDPFFKNLEWEIIPGYQQLREKARSQLGTVGSGNHYVDLLTDDEGTVWIGVHFGSRGFGHTIASGFLAIGQNLAWGSKAPEKEVLLSTKSITGQDYMAAMELAGEYAKIGRHWVCEEVLRILGGQAVHKVENHHNYAWREFHHGEHLIVVRKGATQAFHDQEGFVGGSMGDSSFIVRGVDTLESRSLLSSTVHGAGRIMSRQDAIRGKAVRDENGKVTSRDESTKITQNDMRAIIDYAGVILRGGGVDEAPQVYRSVRSVIDTMGRNTIDVVQELFPVIVVMADKDNRDPYKD